MRFLIFFALLFSINAGSQERFNGTVVYRLVLPETDREADSSARLNVFFGPKAIKLTFKENKKTDNEEILLSFDSSKVFVLDVSNKTYTSKEMIKAKLNEPLPANKKILGYSTTAKQIVTNSPFNKMFAAWGGITIFIADQLNYYVPEEYAGNDELIFIHNNKIVLEGKAIITSALGLEIPEDEISFKLEAVSVTPQQLDPSIFTIPPGYTEEIKMDYDFGIVTPMDDSISMMLDTMPGIIDTAMIVQPEEPVKPAKKPVTPKKKQSTGKSTPARKPE